MRPGRTNVAAWERGPNNDYSPFFVHDSLAHQELKSACNLWSFSAGNSNASVSIIMPKNITQHVGPSVLCIATGKLRWSRIRSTTSTSTGSYFSGRGVQEKKIIEVVDLVTNTCHMKCPSNHVRNCSENFRCRS